MRDDSLASQDTADRDRWVNIELRHLAALATVAEEASFSGAADRLGYVQSAVSQQISSLERIVGERIVERSARPRSVAVTDAGRVLLAHVDDILEQLRLAKAEVDALSEHPEHMVSFGVGTLFGSWLEAAVVGSLLTGDGGAAWEAVTRAADTELLHRVETGALDAAFVSLPIASGPFYALELTQTPCVLAV